MRQSFNQNKVHLRGRRGGRRPTNEEKCFGAPHWWETLHTPPPPAPHPRPKNEAAEPNLAAAMLGGCSFIGHPSRRAGDVLSKYYPFRLLHSLATGKHEGKRTLLFC